MNVYTFLFDIIKLIATISMGILSLSIAFADKLNLDFNDKKTYQSIRILWGSIVITIVMCIASGFLIFDDLQLSIICDKSKTAATTKTLMVLTLVSFSLILISLINIGKIIIKIKREKLKD